ncbi:S1 family peptidase [Micromonospora haikouensis]|uniref:S1 family peptidase n=1 Tax=Micromonospora haikouensis TaxID=686309 RepID=UPI003D93E3EA
MVREEGKRVQLPIYQSFAPCVLAVETEDTSGDVGIGTAFHVGDGVLLTARHVVENRQVLSLIPHRFAEVSRESLRISYPEDDRIDLAVIESDFSLERYMSEQFRIVVGDADAIKFDHIRIGGHLDDWIDDSLVMMDVLLMGYPPIPTSPDPVLVAARGEVNAIIDPYIGSPHPLFVVSPIVRGGFSGGPVLTGGGWLLGITTSSLVVDHAPAELGFGAALTVEPILDLLSKKSLFPASNGELMRELGYQPGGPPPFDPAEFQRLLDESEPF